jgi:aldose 1-epimerase
MKIDRTRVGLTTGHDAQGPAPVDAYVLDTGGWPKVTVWTYGATLVEVIVPDRAGRPANGVLRLPDLMAYEDRERNPYLGCTMGRYARCVARGRFRLDGREYSLDRNMGPHHFHGGSIGFDRFVWDADARREGDELCLSLSLERPDGDQGYPGAVSAQTIYRVRGDGRLVIEHRATTSAATIVAMTNHAFWNLAGSGVVNDHVLAINAARVVQVDDGLIPVGPPMGVAGTPLDFARPRPIAQTRLDHCFTLDTSDWAVSLAEPRSGRVMSVTTDQPGLAVYSADALSRPRSGLCLQTGALPDSPNRPDFPSSRLDPGETYIHRTTVQFSVG